MNFNSLKKWLVPVGVLTTTLALILLPYFNIFKTTFTSSENTMDFFRNASTFNYTSQIIKSEIQARLPEKVQQNLLERSIINRLVDLIVTPQLIENIAEPLIKFQINRLQSKQVFTLSSNNVEFNLQPYKQNLTNYIDSYNLAEGIETTITDFVNSVPNTITVVNGQDNPDSVVLKLVKLREGYHNLLLINTVLWTVVFVGAVLLIVLNYNDLRRLFRIFAKLFTTSAVVVLLLSYILPPLLANLIPTNLSENSGSEISQLINSIITQYFSMSREYVWWYAGLALLCCLLAWYFKSFGFSFSPKKIGNYFQLKYHKIIRR